MLFFDFNDLHEVVKAIANYFSVLLMVEWFFAQLFDVLAGCAQNIAEHGMSRTHSHLFRKYGLQFFTTGCCNLVHAKLGN